VNIKVSIFNRKKKMLLTTDAAGSSDGKVDMTVFLILTFIYF